MAKTIVFKQEEKAVHEVVTKLRNSGYSLRGTLRMALRTGIDKLSEREAKVLTDFIETPEDMDKVFHALVRTNEVTIEKAEVELSLAEAMVALNERNETVTIEYFGDRKDIRWSTDLEDLQEIGIHDFDDLNDAKFFQK